MEVIEWRELSGENSVERIQWRKFGGNHLMGSILCCSCSRLYSDSVLMIWWRELSGGN